MNNLYSMLLAFVLSGCQYTDSGLNQTMVKFKHVDNRFPPKLISLKQVYVPHVGDTVVINKFRYFVVHKEKEEEKILILVRDYQFYE